MAEYIDKQAFNDAIREAVRKYPNSFYNGLEVARQIAHDMDAADVREVVYCKECRHYKPSELIPGDWLCCYHMGAKYYRDRNDFCSKGERGND